MSVAFEAPSHTRGSERNEVTCSDQGTACRTCPSSELSIVTSPPNCIGPREHTPSSIPNPPVLDRHQDPPSCVHCRNVGKSTDSDSVIDMEDRSPSSSNTTDKGESSKHAACLNCRRSKTRCLRDDGDLKCKKCSQTQAECVVPEYRVGRKKGIKK